MNVGEFRLESVEPPPIVDNGEDKDDRDGKGDDDTEDSTTLRIIGRLLCRGSGERGPGVTWSSTIGTCRNKIGITGSK